MNELFDAPDGGNQTRDSVSSLTALCRPELSALFIMHSSITADSAWFGHVPFAHWIVSVAQPRLLVELGTHNGVSYAAFCDAVRAGALQTRCYAVDSWRGDDQAGQYGEGVLANLQPVHDAAYSAFSTLLPCLFDEAVEHFADGSIDLLHIDGFHDYQVVRHDFESWLPKLSPHAVVLLHDIAEHAPGFGVWKLWAELRQSYPAFEFLHGHGLGVLCVGAYPPPALVELCGADAQSAGVIRQRFAVAGRVVEMTARQESAARAVAEQVQQAKQAQHAAEQAEAAAIARAREALAEAGVARAAAAEAATSAVTQARVELDAARRHAETLQGRLETAAASHAAALALTQAAAADQQAAAAVHLAESRAAADEARRAHELMLHSTMWRMTEPLRDVVRLLPSGLRQPTRTLGRTLLRTAWWSVTPWRIPARLHQIRRWRDLAPLAPAVAPPMPIEDTYQRWIERIERRPGAAPAPPVEVAAGTALITLLIFADAAMTERLARSLAAIRQQQAGLAAVIVASPKAAAKAIRPHLWEARGITGLAVEASEASDALGLALAAADSRFIAVLGCGDVLAPGALDAIAAELSRDPATDVLYSDEDTLSDGRRRQPVLKPELSPELLHAYNYFGRLTVIRREAALTAGGYAAGDGEAAEWRLHLNLAEAGLRIRRLPQVLCHRDPRNGTDRPHPATARAGAQRRALAAFWAAQGVAATVATLPDGTQRATWQPAALPLVSVIIPTRDNAKLLGICLDGLLQRTAYARLEIILVDGGSREPATRALYAAIADDPRVRIVAYSGVFNYSRACNLGAASATGTLLLFLNNDIEVTEPQWLAAMVRVASRPGVGVVGAKLCFPDGSLQHAGVVIGMHTCGLVFRGSDETGSGPFGTPDVPRNWLAIMGACQMVQRETFARVGGFDETYLMAYSDVALSLRAWRAGYRTAYIPEAVLLHHEGATRGYTNPGEDTQRIIDDLARLGFDEDPFFHPQLVAENPLPTLRSNAEPATAQILAAAYAGRPDSLRTDATLDLFDDLSLMQASGRRRDELLWPPTLPGAIADERAAARWCMDLLRSRADLRLRFSRTLSTGGQSGFTDWLRAEGAALLGLTETAVSRVVAVLQSDFGRQARQVLLFRDDLRRLWPLGCTPMQRRTLFRWFMNEGRSEAGLQPDEILWFFLEADEDPGRELVRSFLFTPAWQQAVPDGVTVFGRLRLAGWLADKYHLAEGWADPARWPIEMAPDRQVRVAWNANPAWQVPHPAPWASADAALALLAWLCDDAALDEAARAWCRSLDRSAVAAALAAPGLNVIGHFCYPSGLRTSAEALVRGAGQHGIATALRDIRTDPQDEPRHRLFDALEVFDTTLLHTQPEPFFDDVYRLADLAERTPRTTRIAYWYWELDEVPDYWVAKARTVDEIWTATHFVANALKQKVECPVHVLMPGAQLPPYRTMPRRAFGLQEDRFAFVFVFHMMSVMERKNPLGLIRAFRKAFGNNSKVELVLKTSFGIRQPEHLAALQAGCDHANVTLIDELYTAEQTMALIDACDCYVSLHRSEGLGLSMAEAMLMGKPVIATRYSGNLDFMHDGNSLLVDYKLVAFDRLVPPYGSNARWAEPSEEHAAQLMRRVYENRDWARALGDTARIEAEATLSPDAAGQRVAARLRALRCERASHPA